MDSTLMWRPTIVLCGVFVAVLFFFLYVCVVFCVSFFACCREIKFSIIISIIQLFYQPA